ncbi:DciA family protein [Bremerella sp. T1]|uniref:DUF721 domain-containing protein n=1 Tax=Bremerella sp. TYQ1 TaxID=3119568 RepID=UPI001CCE0213|nr:DUF721 domain-containing protein [Bremerella volcania]UBM34442.1 DUF721 domain-containing protein [Bremerella volcania]
MSQRQPGKVQSIKGTLAQLMVQKGYAQVQTADATQKAWDVAAGDRLAQHSVAGNVQRGTLLVLVANSTISQMISFQKPKILKSLQEQLPDHGITDLKIKVGRID